MKLSEEQLAQLDRYLDLLIEWNEKINLTRIVDRADAEVKHIADALTLLKFLPKESTNRHQDNREKGQSGGGKTVSKSDSSFIPHPSSLRLADVGTGGGVPGVPLAICRPDIRVILIDSTKKKLDTIQKIVDAIGLKNVTTMHTRIEQVKMKFDIITARAVADMDTLLQWTGLIMHPQSTLLAMKGPKAQEELAAATRRLGYLKRSARIFPIAVDGLDGHCVVRVL